MVDLISRQDVLLRIDNAISQENRGWVLHELKTLRMCIEHMPSAQPEPQWIPCSERLPEEEGYYWTVHSYMYGHIGYCVSRFAKDLYKVDEYDFAEWKGVSGFYTVDEGYGYIKNEVIAWMPIEPWRGEEHG